MRYLFVVSLSSLCLAAASLSGCASESEDMNKGTSAVATAEDASASATWVGDYHPREGEYPRLTLAADGTYIYDTGIRCIQAPCPSGDAGNWYLGDGFLYLAATTPDALEPQRTLEIASTDPPTLLFEDRSGARQELIQVEEAALPSNCAAVLCQTGMRCEVVDGVARCMP
jgi:hypothetical protein